MAAAKLLHCSLQFVGCNGITCCTPCHDCRCTPQALLQDGDPLHRLATWVHWWAPLPPSAGLCALLLHHRFAVAFMAAACTLASHCAGVLQLRLIDAMLTVDAVVTMAAPAFVVWFSRELLLGECWVAIVNFNPGN
ncbi:hypothetical protein ACLKA6_003843 [Drosophila palustris]